MYLCYYILLSKYYFSKIYSQT